MMNISAVERDTGLGKDTLRVWERRYDFPQPVRDANGERLYPAEQVERLRQIKRLMDQGHRPGRLFAASAEELLAIAGTRRAAAPAEIEKPAGEQDTVDRIVALLKSHNAPGLRQSLHQAMMRQGLTAAATGSA